MSTSIEVRREGGEMEVVTRGGGVMQAATQSRASKEVEAAMMIAKRFPRDSISATDRIIQSCRRPSLASVAVYSFPRGGQTVEGPSIRLAEVLAQNWGNLDCGVVELDRRDGDSTVMAYAIDLETNFRDVRTFDVKHVRDTKRGPQSVRDERDIYEIIANAGARRKRACILAVIPGDIVEAAVEQCNKTMAGASKEPLADRVRKMLAAFEGQGVSAGQVKDRLGHSLDAVTETELAQLRKVYTSIRDGHISADDAFPAATDEAKRSKLIERASAPAATASAPEKPADVMDIAFDGAVIDAAPAPTPEPETQPALPPESQDPTDALREAVEAGGLEAAKNIRNAMEREPMKLANRQAFEGLAKMHAKSLGIELDAKASAVDAINAMTVPQRVELLRAVIAGKLSPATGQIKP